MWGELTDKILNFRNPNSPNSRPLIRPFQSIILVRVIGEDRRPVTAAADRPQVAFCLLIFICQKRRAGCVGLLTGVVGLDMLYVIALYIFL
ncbi:unnamed protein product [Victoria cruziana]